ncbi:uncharacterized protein LOC108674122 isoform X2 [Hyalella azteca]|uniref:Uncharacterized protein LOC108674122 isoform X2 n=1 Tax=Hyalella azteca TaxID=294128 RepID=A0A979FVW7_HYAAZ|nr:uncharacterized protein LOC108674122 isoform X2 [Hyalella azteca]
MTGPQKVVLLACGSYNPPTNLHLRMFELARDYLHRTTNFHVIAGLISPVHDKYGKEGLAGSNDRCQMVRLALTSSTWIHLSDWETRQEEWTPTREVLQYHQDLMDSAVNGNLDGSVKRQRMDNSVPWLSHLTTALSSVGSGGGGRHLQQDPVTVKLLCGADLLESFGKPGVWKEEDIEMIVGKFGIVVVTREGSNPYKFIYESDTLSRLQRNIHIVTEWISNDVSSTKVRRALKRGESVKYLLQDPVIDFIQKHVLYDTHNNKYTVTPSVLTPSPNPETDVLLPPPNFTISQQPQKHVMQHHKMKQQAQQIQDHQHLTATLTRQHARQNSTPSDMEQDTPPGLSPAADLSPVPHPAPVIRLYPGQARPVKQRTGEVGGAAAGGGMVPGTQQQRGQQNTIWRDHQSTTQMNAVTASLSSSALTPTHIGVDRLLESTKKELSAIAAKSSNTDYMSSLSTGKSKKSTGRTNLMQSSSEPTPMLFKSHSVSPKKGSSPLPDATSKKIFANHNRSKSSVSLKPERAYDLNQNASDDLVVRFRDNYTRSLSTGSTNIYELLSRTREISPSHTEICLTHVPSRHYEKPIGPRSRNGDRLFTSRSLERPSTPRMDRSLSPPRKVASLPISRGRSRERSPSPYQLEPRRSIDLQLGSKRSSINYDDLEMELRCLPRALTHEEEINMIIQGESANYLRMATPDSFPAIDAPSSESVVSNESEYEMRF